MALSIARGGSRQTHWPETDLGLALPSTSGRAATMAPMPRSVLVVDDDAAFRALAARTLRSWGYVVVGEAATFAEALERPTALRPDAVLVDIGLPDGDGFALAQRLSPCRGARASC